MPQPLLRSEESAAEAAGSRSRRGAAAEEEEPGTNYETPRVQLCFAFLRWIYESVRQTACRVGPMFIKSIMFIDHLTLLLSLITHGIKHVCASSELIGNSTY